MSKKEKFKVLGKLAVVSSLVLAVAACSGKGGSSGQTDGPAQTEQAANPGAGNGKETEKLTFKAMTADFGRTRDLKIDQEFNKKLNVDIKWDLIPLGDYFNKLKVVLASNDLPDLLLTRKEIIDQFGPQGYFVDLYPYLDKMPNAKKWAEKYPGFINEVITGDNKLYGINNFNTRGQMPVGYMYREDVFQENGLTEPKTLDELYNSLKILKAKYPDSTPIVNRWGANNLISAFTNAYRVKNAFYLNIDEMAYKYGPTEDNFKKAIAQMAKFYKDKLIDPEFATLSDAQFEERITTGKAFLLMNEYFYEINDGSNWQGKGEKSNSKFKLKSFLPPQTEAGQALVFVQYPTSGGGWVVSINAKSKHIDQLVQLLDRQLSDEIIELTNWGIEGETFTRKDGKRKYADNLKWPNNPNGTVDPMSIGLDHRAGMWVPLDQEAIDSKLLDASNITLYNQNASKIGFFQGPPIKFTEAELEEINRIQVPLDTYVQESLIKFITGTWNMEANWDEFQKKLESLNYKKILNMYQDKYSQIPDAQKKLNKDIGL